MAGKTSVKMAGKAVAGKKVSAKQAPNTGKKISAYKARSVK